MNSESPHSAQLSHLFFLFEQAVEQMPCRPCIGKEQFSELALEVGINFELFVSDRMDERHTGAAPPTLLEEIEEFLSSVEATYRDASDEVIPEGASRDQLRLAWVAHTLGIFRTTVGQEWAPACPDDWILLLDTTGRLLKRNFSSHRQCT